MLRVHLKLVRRGGKIAVGDLHAAGGPAARQTASEARSPDCAVAPVVLAHAYLHGKCRGRVHENDGIDISKRLTKINCDKRRRAEVWPSDCHPSNPHRDFERRLYREVFNLS